MSEPQPLSAASPIPAPAARIVDTAHNLVQVDWTPVFELLAALPPGASREIQVPSNVVPAVFISRLRANLVNNKRTRDHRWSVFSKGHDSVWVKREWEKGGMTPRYDAHRVQQVANGTAAPETLLEHLLAPAPAPVALPNPDPITPVITDDETKSIRKIQFGDRSIEYQPSPQTIPEMLLAKLPDFCGDWEVGAMQSWLEAYETVARLILERVPISQPTVKTVIK